MKQVVFACVHNAGRSQIAAAFLNALADPEKARAKSAGTHPADRVHPEVVDAMREVGIDLAGAAPALLTSESAADASLLVTLGCGEACPVLPGVRREDWPIPDPKGMPASGVREIRDAIRSRVEALVAREGWATPDTRGQGSEQVRKPGFGSSCASMRRSVRPPRGQARRSGESPTVEDEPP
jgi:arsenate reductase